MPNELVMLIILLLVINSAICAFLGALVGARKNADGAGLWLGMLLGPIGVLVAFALDGRPACPQCGDRINPGAKMCRSCRSTLSDLAESVRPGLDAELARQAEVERQMVARELAAQKLWEAERDRDWEEFRETWNERKIRFQRWRTAASKSAWRVLAWPFRTVNSFAYTMSGGERWTQLVLAATFYFVLASTVAIIYWQVSSSSARAVSEAVAVKATAPETPSLSTTLPTPEKPALPVSVPEGTQLAPDLPEPPPRPTTPQPPNLVILQDLQFRGLGGDRNRLGPFRIDGGWTQSGTELQPAGGGYRAARLGHGNSFDLSCDLDYGNVGGSFWLIGWNKGTGYLIHETGLRNSGAWQLVYINNGVALPERVRHLSQFRVFGHRPVTLRVTRGRLSLRCGDVVIADSVPMIDYKPGEVILGTFPNQYGSRPLKILQWSFRIH